MRCRVGTDTSPVEAKDTVVLLDADEATLVVVESLRASSSPPTPARASMRVDDGGVTGPTFFEHVRRLRRPVLNNPEGTGRRRCPAGWCGVRWCTPHRCGRGRWCGAAAKTNPAVRAVIDAFTGDVGDTSR